MDLSLRILSLTFLTAAFCSNVISGQLYLQPAKTEHGYFTDESFVITCYTTSQSGDQLKWIFDKDEREITDTDGRIHVQPAGGLQHGLELVVENVEMDDAGRYVCSDVHDSTYFELIVYRSISFGGTPKEQSAVEGGDAIIKCHVKSDPKPGVSWYHNGIKLETGSKYTVGIEENNQDLIIHNISRSDAGIYKCNAYSIAYLSSQMNDFEIMVHVEYSPELIGEENDVAYASLDSLANISCQAMAQPAPKFEWFRDDSEITSSPDHTIFHSANESTLQIKMNSESQFGKYTCRAMNIRGETEKTIELKEGATPDAPFVSVLKEDQGQVYLSIRMPDSYDDDLNVSGYKVKYALKSDPSNSTKFQDFSYGEEYILKNMSYNSEYIIQVAARNAAGHGEYSEKIPHKTQTLQVAPVVKDSGSTSIKATSALLLVTLLICM